MPLTLYSGSPSLFLMLSPLRFQLKAWSIYQGAFTLLEFKFQNVCSTFTTAKITAQLTNLTNVFYGFSRNRAPWVRFQISLMILATLYEDLWATSLLVSVFWDIASQVPISLPALNSNLSLLKLVLSLSFYIIDLWFENDLKRKAVLNVALQAWTFSSKNSITSLFLPV